MAKKIFNSPSELDAYFKDKNNINDIASAAVTNSNAIHKSLEISDKDLMHYAKELERNIKENLSKIHCNPLGNIFGDTTIEKSDSNKRLIIKFNNNSYRESYFENDKHVSFVPILFDYGWQVGEGKVSRMIKRNTPTFAYYSGSFFITNAINAFNKKYNQEGIWAKFILGDMEVSVYSGKLPYRRQ